MAQQEPQTKPRNGFVIAALICGILACLSAFIPIAFVVGAPLAVCAVVFGVIGVARDRQGTGSFGGTAALSVLLGLIAGLFAYNHGADFIRKSDPVYQQQTECFIEAETDAAMNACFE